MSYFYLKFDTDNAAFEEHERGEIVRALREVADRIANGVSMDKHRNIFDSNGSIVGTFVHKETE